MYSFSPLFHFKILCCTAALRRTTLYGLLYLFAFGVVAGSVLSCFIASDGPILTP